MIPTKNNIKVFLHLILLFVLINSPATIQILLIVIYAVVIIAALKLIKAFTGTKKEDKRR